MENESHMLEPGEVLIIPSGAVHELFAPQDGGSRYFIMVDQSEISALEGLSAIEHCFYPCIHINASSGWELQQRARAYLDNIIREYRTGGLLADAAARLQLHMLLVDVVRTKLSLVEEKQDQPRRTKKQMLFSDISSYIVAHCTEQLSVESVADRSGYSRNHFERLFRTYTGLTFHDFVLRQRINLCKHRLASSNESVTDIAMKCGFGSIATFNRVFHSLEGLSPSEFRSMLQGPPSEQTIRKSMASRTESEVQP